MTWKDEIRKGFPKGIKTREAHTLDDTDQELTREDTLYNELSVIANLIDKALHENELPTGHESSDIRLFLLELKGSIDLFQIGEHKLKR